MSISKSKKKTATEFCKPNWIYCSWQYWIQKQANLITYLQDIHLPKANFSLIQTISDQHIFSNFPTKNQLRTFQNIPISLEILSNKAMMYGSQTLMKNLMIVFTIYQPLDFNHLTSMVDKSSNTVIIQIPITVFSS